MKIGHQAVNHLKLDARINKNIGFARPCGQRAAAGHLAGFGGTFAKLDAYLVKLQG